MHTETLDPKAQRIGDFKEGFNFGPFQDGKATQPIPSIIQPHEAELAAFRASCHSLCLKLLHLFGIGLGVNPPSFFTSAHSPSEPSGSILRFLYYPAPTTTVVGARQEGDVRAGAHSDYGSITLLFRLKGQAGLELLAPATNTWAPVPVCPPGTENDPLPPILVNIGDLLSYWTNGLLRSTVHRVTFASPSDAGNGNDSGRSSAGLADGEGTADPRYSIVYFCHPADQTPLTAVPSERIHAFRGANSEEALRGAKEGNPYAERKVLTADEHLQMRLRASYLQMYADNEKGN
ncbi:Clavaminate synthase-like protein [Xylariomycetidae sp. FL2044]|nr:Clavaminate synthase-like protein [Xylariomycetidae sp. FL2044]